MNEGELYAGREQTLVKHYIHERYLERFAHIVGSAWNSITYIDCFSGPWNARSERLEDSSFAMAVAQLKAAREHVADLRQSRGRPPLELRCFFLEKNPTAFAKLSEFARGISDATIATRNSTLEESIDALLAFVHERRDSFPFIFVDPTGWSGFGLDVIAPLLKLQPGEVLINFMTGHVLRFAEVDDPATSRSFDRLFGSIDYRARIADLTGQDREDELVRCYMDAIRATGGFEFVCSALVLRPENDRTHFHLIYATRSPKGVEEFKQVEKKGMEVMEQARGEARQRRRRSRSGQLEMFGAVEMHDPRHYIHLRERYVTAAKQQVEDSVRRHRTVLYDDVWAAALTQPLVWESDLKFWIREWSKSGAIGLDGLEGRERVPKRGANHRLVWRGKAP
jgi:three-Cys-motif partner protein